METAADILRSGRAVLGIELGSTRIKAVLVGPDHAVLATGDFQWENQLVDGVWTYDLQDAVRGLQAAYRALKADAAARHGVTLTALAGIGVSAMMHGYLAFSEGMRLLVPFRTWRNVMTGQAAEELTQAFHFSIPQRWTVAHLYQAILRDEPHVKDIRLVTTLAGYVHWLLTGVTDLGTGDASGMFPLDEHGAYDPRRVETFDGLAAPKGYPWRLMDVLPGILEAGREAGRLTEQGAKLLDPDGDLRAGIPFCPPEGDAGTGMVATNAVAPRTGNLSAGTSIFAIVVLERALSAIHPEIDIACTPDGKPVAIVHGSNCTTDLNSWIGLLHDFATAAGVDIPRAKLFQVFFDEALKGPADAGGVTTCGYYSGEHITGFEEGRPLLAHSPTGGLTLASLARSVLYSAFATLKIGFEALEEERVRLDKLVGHGGLYKQGEAGQRFTAAALGAPVTVMETAGEGGAWGIGLLAAYMAWKAPGETLGRYLEDRVFSGMKGRTMAPDPRDVEGFGVYMQRFKALLEVERAAVRHLPA
ncbi:MAG TPA: FGGY-family carbohydrate kinase [Candidatus Limnocylindria bacterium]|nr:FGGY-family carbohydrate kinase [Candidatus Limnocylindria bacterium]